jgi:hypothetical protein
MPVIERSGRRQRKAWRIIALASAGLFVVLCAFFAAPLVLDFAYRAPLAPTDEAALIRENLTATPEQGGTEQQVTLSTSGLEPGAEVAILAGIDPERLRALATDQADDQGRLNAEVEIPEWAERGRPFYFAAEQNGARIGLASVNVIVLDQVAPAAAGGSVPPEQ